MINHRTFHSLKGLSAQWINLGKLGDSRRQGSLLCGSQWDCKELDMTERLNNNKNLTKRTTEHRRMYFYASKIKLMQ